MRAIARGPGVAGRAAATALVVAPLAWACVLLLSDLHERPDGRRAVAIPGAGVEVPLVEGRTVAIPLAADSVPYRAVAVRFGAASPARVTLRLCGSAACDDRTMEVANGDVAVLAVPPDAAAGGGALSLTPTAISGGPVALRGDPATPSVEVVQGHSWRLPARRAREVYQALAGADVFLAALGVSTLALALALAACQVLGFREAAGDETTGPGSRGTGDVRAPGALRPDDGGL
ncbi:MAG: hypothetical protein ACXWLR_11340 [Myxococcales bacterium]